MYSTQHVYLFFSSLFFRTRSLLSAGWSDAKHRKRCGLTVKTVKEHLVQKTQNEIKIVVTFELLLVAPQRSGYQPILLVHYRISLIISRTFLHETSHPKNGV